MRVIPAIDIRRGNVVRLIQGNAALETIYSDSPVDVAKRWEGCGAEAIHVVDLDGAIEGELRNIKIIKSMAKAVRARIEFGGGVRDESIVKDLLDSGVDKVVIGTKALDDNFLNTIVKKFGDRIIVAIDASEGIVYTKGWVFATKMKAIDLANKAVKAGVKRINYTDISKDGTLEGPNFRSIKELLGSTKAQVVTSGGISTLDDIKKLKTLEKNGLTGIIIGKALYQNTIDLNEAIEICSQKESFRA